MDMQKFHELKPQMQTGDLLAISTDGVIPSIIKHKTHSKFSHVAMLIRFNEAEAWVFMVHASKHGGGVYFELTSRFLQHLHGEAAWLPLDHKRAAKANPDYKADITYEALMQVGLRYNMNTLWRRQFGIMGRFFARELKDAWCCSYLAAHLLKRSKLIKSVSMTPQELIDLSLYPTLTTLTPGEEG